MPCLDWRSDPAGRPADSATPKRFAQQQASAREGTASRAPPLGICPGALRRAASRGVRDPKHTHPKLQRPAVGLLAGVQ